MLNRSLWALTFVGAGFLCLVRADTLQEDFSSDPKGRGWNAWGNTNLFAWDNVRNGLSVTWDSSSSNSYYYHGLGTVLARDDDFSLEFDLFLNDITNTTKPGPFEIAISLINWQQATRDGYQRGSGIDAVHGPRSIFEFDYFPHGYIAGWGDVDPSFSPTIVSTDNLFAAGFDLMELTNGQSYHVTLQYSGAGSVLHTAILCNGAALGPFADVPLGTNFTDFRLDTVAVCSYSDAGDDYDSVLAHGSIDNLRVTMPAPPVQLVNGFFSNGVYAVQFSTGTNWLYALDRSTDLVSWTAASSALNGTGTTLTLEDTNALSRSAFYRVRASRP